MNIYIPLRIQLKSMLCLIFFCVSCLCLRAPILIDFMPNHLFVCLEMFVVKFPFNFQFCASIRFQFEISNDERKTKKKTRNWIKQMRRMLAEKKKLRTEIYSKCWSKSYSKRPFSVHSSVSITYNNIHETTVDSSRVLERTIRNSCLMCVLLLLLSCCYFIPFYGLFFFPFSLLFAFTLHRIYFSYSHSVFLLRPKKCFVCCCFFFSLIL